MVKNSSTSKIIGRYLIVNTVNSSTIRKSSALVFETSPAKSSKKKKSEEMKKQNIVSPVNITTKRTLKGKKNIPFFL